MANDSASKGLADVVVSKTKITSIDGQSGKLFHRGYEISDLAKNSNFEELSYLLFHGDLPSNSDLSSHKNLIYSNRHVSDKITDLIKEFPTNSNTMDFLRTVVSYLALFDPDAGDNSQEANMNKSIRLLAQMPTVLSYFHRIRNNLEIIPPDDNLDFSSNFLYMLSGERPDELASKCLDQCLILHADHGFNASTFSARVTVSTLSDVHSAITSAIGTLKGPLHGGANESVLKMLKEIKDVENVSTYISDKLSRKEKIMGFGHRVYLTIDPRATVLREMSKDLQTKFGGNLYDLSYEIEQTVLEQKNLKPNVDFYAASVYSMLSIDSSLFTPLFACSRVSGWCAQILEQLEDNRLIRPRAEYVGYSPRSYAESNTR